MDIIAGFAPILLKYNITHDKIALTIINATAEKCNKCRQGIF